MNFNSNKKFNPHKLLLNLIDEINLKRSGKCCLIKSQLVLYMEKYKQVTQEQ